MGRRIQPVGILYGHQAWFKLLFAQLERRRIPFVPIHAASHQYDAGETESPFSLVINRMSSSAHPRGHIQGIFHTTQYLYHLEKLGVPIINGAAAQLIESPKAKQLALLSSLGLRFPRTKIVNHIDQVIPAALSLRFPIVIKGNIGGSGTVIVRFDTLEGLRKAVSLYQITLGIDATTLVQEYLTAKDNHIVRVETLDQKFLYSIKVHTLGGSFNLCPAELRMVPDLQEAQAYLTGASHKGTRVDSYSPPAEIVRSAERIAREAQLDVGGIEYLINEEDGEPYFYGINALSSFVGDAVDIVGFDPYVEFVSYIEQRLELAHQVRETTIL